MFAAGQDDVAWNKLIAALGVAPADTVVVYDDQAKDAARMWYILRSWSIEDARLLNGGWKAWQASGGKTESETPSTEPTKNLKLRPQADRLATKAQMLDLLKGKTPQIVDARSDGEFCGADFATRREARAAIFE